MESNDVIQPLSDLQHIRLRPGMYVGSMDFFGLIHYLVGGVNWLLQSHPTTISIEAGDDGVVLSADSSLPVPDSKFGHIAPFEQLTIPGRLHDLDAAVLAALSLELAVEIVSQGERWEFAFRQGQRVSLDVEKSHEVPSIRLRAIPDPSLFSVTSISPFNFHSYLRRMSYLHAGVRFQFTSEGETAQYYSSLGLRDMYTAITAPYQILHEPIHLSWRESDLELELVMGFQSWSNDVLLTFINRGRAADGGSHEEGL